MKRYIYYRVSTDEQDFLQQRECVRQYLESEGIGMDKIAGTKTEKISGKIDPDERVLYDLLSLCENGDIIYVSEQSRLCRSLKNSIMFMEDCGLRGVSVICCKEHKKLDPDSIEFVIMSWLAEQERKRISFNTKMALTAQKREIAEHGGWTAKRSGVWRTHHGSPKGDAAYNHDTSAATSAAKEAAKEKRNQSAAFKLVAQLVADGWSNPRILQELQRLRALAPESFSSPDGGDFTRATIHRWKKIILAGD